MAGDGRCDSPGHCAKYCTYTLLDVESQKVVDFKVVSEVANCNCMKKKGFVDTLSNIEANGIKVGVISTDRHPQIKKEMRVNHPNIDHQFDPWHIAKSVSKKFSAASKKSGCSELAPWIPSIVNHLWWSAESCGKDPEVLKERWLSVIHHVTNRHEWPGNRHFHKCEHGRLTTEEQRRKKWLKPGSTAQYFNSKSKCQQANSPYLSPYICYQTSGKVVKQKYNFLLLIIFFIFVTSLVDIARGKKILISQVYHSARDVQCWFNINIFVIHFLHGRNMYLLISTRL